MNSNIYKTVLYGIPFNIADEYAYKSGKYRFNDPRRLLGALTETFNQKISQGHTTIPSSKLLDKFEKQNGKVILKRTGSLQEAVTKVLSQSGTYFEEQHKLFEWYETTDGDIVPRLNTHLFYSTLEMMNDLKLFSRKIFDFNEYNGKPYLNHLPSYWSEQQICKRIISLLQAKPLFNVSKNKIYQKALERGADSKQAAAISNAFENKVSIITGGPGTGKSQTIKMLVEIALEEKPDINIKICGPTGRAAQNLQDRLLKSQFKQVRDYFSDEENKCRTAHSLLNIKPSTAIGMCRTKYSYKKHPLEADLLIFDEASMGDIYLSRSLLWSIPDYAHVVIIGDPDQLNSIGPGQVLHDLTHGLRNLEEKTTENLKLKPKWTELTEIHRTDKDSRIPFLAKALKIKSKDERWKSFHCELKNCIEQGNVKYIESDDIDSILKLCVQEYISESKDGIDVSLISPRYEAGVGITPLNNEIQKKLLGNTGFVEGAIIIQNRNDYLNGVLNGEKGYIQSLSTDYLTACFPNERIVTLSWNQAEKDWIIGYCSSVYKSQGTESSVIILPVWEEPKKHIWNVSAFYTALTRSKQRLTIIGNNSALEKAVKSNTPKRFTRIPLFYHSFLKKETQ